MKLSQFMGPLLIGSLENGWWYILCAAANQGTTEYEPEMVPAVLIIVFTKRRHDFDQDCDMRRL